MKRDRESEMIHRELDPGRDDPSLEIVEIVAELENQAADELPSIWTCINDLLDEIFSNPPSPDAQVEVRFTYEGYRITVEQTGMTTFTKIG